MVSDCLCDIGSKSIQIYQISIDSWAARDANTAETSVEEEQIN